MNDNSYKIIEVDINEILPNRFQPRIQFDEEEILELSDSIKEHGVIQPIVVRTIGDKYEIIAGERRYKASVLAGKDTVPVIVKNLDDKDSAEIALIENIQRKNLTPIEEALSYKKILDMGYLTQETLANKIGKSQSSVANKIRLLNLSDEVQEALLDNKISERHARSLLRLKSTLEQNEMLEKIMKERLTVRKTDEEIDRILKGEKGEEKMNSNINQISNEVAPEVMNTFDIFGETKVESPVPTIEVPPIQPIIELTPAPVAQSAPVVPAVPEVPVAAPVAPVAPAVPEVQAAPQIGGIQFDANGNVISMGEVSAPVAQPAPVVPTMPEVPVAAPVAPVAPVTPEVQAAPQIGGIQFDANGNVISMGEVSAPVAQPAPVVPAVPEVPVAAPVAPVAPVTPEVQAAPQIGGIQFDANGNVISMGEVSAPVAQPAPAVPEVQAAPQIGGIQFDANGNVISMGEVSAPVAQPAPAVPTMPEVPVAAPVAPVSPVTPEVQAAPQIGGIQFDANGNVISMGEVSAPVAQPAPAVPTMPEVPVATPVAPVSPVTPEVQAAPQIGGIQFDANGNVISMGEVSAPVVPAVPEVPVTAPIMESTAVAPVVPAVPEAQPAPVNIPVQPIVTEPATIPSAISMPEPIIVADYSKQYDPVMPNQNVPTTNKVDFKEIINIIRECSSQIEKCGYYIDVEEYDLSSSYQVIFKIEK